MDTPVALESKHIQSLEPPGIEKVGKKEGKKSAAAKARTSFRCNTDRIILFTKTLNG